MPGQVTTRSWQCGLAELGSGSFGRRRCVIGACRGLASRPWVCLLSFDSFLSISSASSEPRVQGESRVEMGTGMVLDMVTDAHHDMSGLSGHGMRDEVRKKTWHLSKSRRNRRVAMVWHWAPRGGAALHHCVNFEGEEGVCAYRHTRGRQRSN